MRQWQAVALTALSAVFVPHLAGAASGDADAEVDVYEAIEMALGSNIDLKKSATSVETSEISVSTSKSAFMPMIQASLGPSMQLGKHLDQATGEYVGVLGGSFSLGIGLGITVFDGLASWRLLERSKLGLEASKLTLTRAQQETVYATVSAYVGVLDAREMVVVGEENLASQEKMLELVRARKEAGKALLPDVLKQQAEVEKARLALMQARSRIDMALLDLRHVIGLDQGAEISVVPLGVPDDAGEWPGMDVESAVAFAIDNRPDAKASGKLIAAAEKQVQAEKAGWSPTISVSLSAGTSWSSNAIGSQGFVDQFFVNNPSGVLGLGVSIPIFDGLYTKHRVESAKVAVHAAQLDLEGIELAIELQVAQAYENLEQASAQLEVAEKQLEYASESRKAYEQTYAAGGCTLVDLSQARALELEATRDVVEARYGLLLGAVAISFAMGDSDGMIEVLSAGGAKG